MLNPHLETAAQAFKQGIPVHHLGVSEAHNLIRSEGLLAIAFEMNRFNNFLENENKVGGTFWYLRNIANQAGKPTTTFEENEL